MGEFDIKDLTRRSLAYGKAHDTELLVVASEINEEFTKAVRKIAATPARRKNVALILTTPGGDADEAYRIWRTLKRRYQKLTIVIHGECKSAGTLIALGADEVVMSDSGELGPLDVQLRRPDEIGGPRQSGLDLEQALRVLETNMLQTFQSHVLAIRMGAKLSTRMAAKLACVLTTSAYRNIYKQIDPIRLGEVQRQIVIASDYGDRMSSENVKEGTVAALVADYSSHSFVIDREEATQLFRHVRAPTDEELGILCALPDFVFELQYVKSYVFPLEIPDEEEHDHGSSNGQPAASGSSAGPNSAPSGDAASGAGDEQQRPGPASDPSVGKSERLGRSDGGDVAAFLRGSVSPRS